MDNDVFQRIVEDQFDLCRETLNFKGKGYARGADRLYNFKRAGMMLDCSPELALRGMWAKHLISILDIIDDTSAGKDMPIEVINEKFTDGIDYILLLRALILERKMCQSLQCTVKNQAS